MTTVNPSFTVLDGRRFQITWAALSPSDEGAPVEVSGAQWRSFQVLGGSPIGSVDINVSNDGSNWGNPVSLTDRTPTDFNNRARYVKPVRAGGSGATDVILICSN